MTLKKKIPLLLIFAFLFCFLLKAEINIVGNNVPIDTVNRGKSTTIQTGCSLYEGVVNPVNSKAYFYSRAEHDKSDIFAVNTTDNTAYKFATIEESIGGIVYNANTNELLVSTYSDDSENGEVIVYNCDNGGSATFELTGYNLLETMYISDAGKLYITSGMRNNATPYVHIYDAVTGSYSHLGSVAITGFAAGEELSRLKAGFCDNGNNGVYAFISAVTETATDLSENTTTGVLFNMDENYNISYYSGSANYRKVLKNSINDLIYVLTEGDIFSISYNHSLGIFSTATAVLAPGSELSPIDMDIDKTTGRQYYAARYSGDYILWTVSLENSYETILSFGSEDKEILSLYYNDTDKKVYTYTIPGDGNDDDRHTYLSWYDQLDGTTGTIQLSDEAASNLCLPDTKDDGYIYYNRNQILYDPNYKKLFIPNGMQSNISSISIDYEYLDLGNDIRWLSYPRIENLASAGAQYVVSSNAMNDMIVGEEFDEGELKYYSGGDVFYLVWDAESEEWTPDDDYPLDNIYSKNGYKLNLYDNEQRWLKLEGSVEDPDLEFEIYNGDENWVGYFLPYSQSPFDAISETFLDEISLIKGQYWTCVHTWCDNNLTPCWICAVSKGIDEPVINYGDMVVIEIFSNDIEDFQWQLSATQGVSAEEREETINYTFTEQSDYSAVFVELDTTDNPVEIGAFVEDSCVGATTVLEEDTLVMIATYTEGISGDIYFEEYYGDMKSTSPPVKSYMVKNSANEKYINRTINTGENKPCYFVSFKAKNETEENKGIDTNMDISCYPNPAQGSCTINYSIKSNKPVAATITIYGLYGNKVNELQQGEVTPGSYSTDFSLCNASGGKLESGIYIIELRSGHSYKQCKLVVIN